MAIAEGVVLGHVNIEVTNLRRARHFYDRFLSTIGFSRVPPADPVWLGYRKGRVTLWVTVSHPRRVSRATPHVPKDGIEDPISDHLGFRAPSAKRVGAIERALRHKGFKPVYATAKQRAHGPSWYTSNAWRDPDNNVLEVYAVTQR
jgi:catechol 2,3-dioxygenase-like lactoylglutathione lyase family enzyme